MESFFAPAERDSPGEILASPAVSEARGIYGTVLDLLPDMVFVANARRQVVYANSAALQGLGRSQAEATGDRLGELLGCMHATENPGGCGTSKACKVCGAVGTILEALDVDGRVSREARITTRGKAGLESIEALVTALAFAVQKEKFVLVTLKDRRDSERRLVLERIFFHDVMNGLASIQAGISLLGMQDGGNAETQNLYRRLASAASTLVDEVNQQRDIILMEVGELQPTFRPTDLVSLARLIIGNFEFNQAAQGKSMILDCGPCGGAGGADGAGGDASLVVETDPVLLGRVLQNMIKNAVEASTPGEEVRISLGQEGEGFVLAVHNSAFISPEDQLQVFQRSFSTKGRGRGLGTYSMRMLTEGYLRGRIGFSSTKAGGTSFWVILPAAAG